MSKATSVSDLERAEHLGYADSKGVKRVSVFNDGVQINAATSDNQTDGTQKTQITNGTDEVDVINANGEKGLVTISPGHISDGNSTSTPLSADGVFTGEAEEVTNFGVIVITVKSDVASATDGLSIQQSTDGTNWDCLDVFTIPADTSKVFSFQTCARYLRVVYTNGESDQTYLRLQTIVKPYYVKPSSHRIADEISAQDDAELVKAVLTGRKPNNGDFVNFQATTAGNFKMSLEELESGIATNSNSQLNTSIYSKYGRIVDVDDLGSLRTYEPTVLVGASFEGTTLDTNFWTATVANGGTVTQDGEALLETNTTANGTAQLDSVRKARKIPGTVNQFRAVGHFETDPQANNVRTLGVYDDDNGAFFKLDGTTLKVVTRKGGVDTEVSSGSFNGDVSSITPDTEIHRWAITYTAVAAKFWYDSDLVHTVSSTSEPWTESLTEGIRLENNNLGGNTTDNKMHFQLLTILRFGKLQTEAISKYQSGTIAGLILKYGAGELKRAIISGVVNNSVITLYDNTAASGTILWSSGTMGAQTQPFSLDFGDLPFSTGLTLAITGANSNITVVYE